MPKVLRIINRFNLGGPTYNVTFLTRYMDDRFDTLLVGGIPDKGEADSLHIPEKYGVKPKIIKSLERDLNFKNDRKAYREIKKIIEELQPDIVHTHASKAGALGRRAAIKAKVPVILHTFHGHVFHSYFGKLKTTLYQKIEQRLAAKSTGIIAISPKQKKELTTQYKITAPEKCHVVRLGFDLSIFKESPEEYRNQMHSQYKVDKDTVTIGIIGRLAPIKDHAFFLKCVGKLITEQKIQSKVRVFIIGDGALKDEIKEQAFRISEITKQKDLFTFTSWVNFLPEIIHGLDIVALSSRNEGTPVSIIEGMAAQKPVISTQVGGVEDLITNGENGFYSTVNDIDQYTDNLALLINNSDLRLKMGKKGAEFAYSNYNYDILVKNMEKLYDQLLNQVK